MPGLLNGSNDVLPRCDFSSALHALSPIRCVATLLPGSVVGVANLPVLTPRSETYAWSSREIRSVVHAVSVQMMGWGASICFQEAAQLLARLIPGLPLPLGLFDAVRCLGAAARRDLMQIVHAGICAVVAHGDAMNYVRSILDEETLARVEFATGHRDVVLGLAVCALVYERLHIDVPERPQTWSGRSVVGLIGCLRIISNALGVGTRSTNNGDPIAAWAESFPGQTCVDANPRDVTALDNALPFEQSVVMNAFPLAGSLVYRDHCDVSDLTVAGWGVEARGRGRGGRRRPKNPAGGPAAKGGKGDNDAQRRRPITTGIGTGMGTGAKSSDQRDTFSAPDGTGPGYSSSGKLKKRKNNPQPPKVQEKPAVEQREGQLGHEGGASKRLTTAPDSPDGSSSAAPGENIEACLRFDNLDRSRHQIRKLPRLHEDGEKEGRSVSVAHNVLFCVHKNAINLFENMLPVNTTTEGSIVAFRAIPEPMCAGEVSEHVRMYSGLRQLLQAEPRDSAPLGDYRLYRVATISVISDSARQIHGVSDDRMIQSNQLNVMRVAQCHGEERHFISFFARNSAPLRAGINFGFREIEWKDGHPAIRDGDFLLETNSEDVGNLVPRIEDKSGLRYRGSGLDISAPADHRDVQMLDSNHFFIRLEALPSIPVDRGADLLPAHELHGVTIDADGARSAALSAMYRMTFLIAGDVILYVDRAGRRGALYLQTSSTGVRGLSARSGVGTAFLEKHGLEGCVIKEAAVILENYGFNRMPLPGEAATENSFPLNGFRITYDGQGDQTLPNTQTSWDGKSGTFLIDFDNRQIRYTDTDGTAGLLEFSTVRHHPHGNIVLEGNELSDMLFASRAGLVEYVEYTWREIRGALHAKGYVEGGSAP